jgi:hypothetical protein
MPSKGPIVAHVAIGCLVLAAGLLGRASYALSCTYAKQPFGSSCNAFEDLLAFLKLSVPTAAVLYAAWGVFLIARRVLTSSSR